MKRPVGRPAIPIVRPKVPEQDRPDDGLAWYIVAMKPGADAVTTRQRLQDQGFACWCPLAMHGRQHAGRRSLVLRALWSPYLFIGLSEQQGLAPIRKVPGVLDAVRSDKGRVLVIDPERLGQAWDKLQAMGGYVDQTPGSRGMQRHSAGDELFIARGAFSGFPAVFLDYSGERLRVIVSLFGRPTTAMLDVDQVEAVK